MDEYRIERAVEANNWTVRHEDRGEVGRIDRIGSDFRAMVEGGATLIGSSRSLKSLTEQVIWYDRAINQEGE